MFYGSLQFHCTFCMQRETQAEIIVWEVSGCTVSDCTVTSISWTGNPSKGPREGEEKSKKKKKAKKKAYLFFRILRHMQKSFRINWSFPLSSFPFLPLKGMTTSLLPHFVILSLPSFAKRDKGIQTHTFLLSLPKAQIIFRTRSSQVRSSIWPFPQMKLFFNTL